MFTHPDTVCTLNTLNHQERLEHAAKQRLAGSALLERRTAAPPAATGRRGAFFWLGRMCGKACGPFRLRLTRLLATGQP